MSLYHLSAKLIKRSGGRSSVAAAAYRSGEGMDDRRQGLRFDYARKQRIEHTGILAPACAPPWVRDRSLLWNSIEVAEIRADAQLAREFEVALPVELNAAQRRELVTRFVAEELVARGMVADIAIHVDSENKNPHAHIMTGLRTINEEGWGLKERAWNATTLLLQIREAWADHANRALADAGSSARVDHRSLIEQGIEREPQIHHANQPMRIQRNAQIIEFNTVRAALILSLHEDRLANQSPQEIQERARAEYVAAHLALNNLEAERSQLCAAIKRIESKRVGSARNYVERNSERLKVAKEKADSARNDAIAAQRSWDLWRQAHPIQAELPIALLFGQGAELLARVNATEKAKMANEEALRKTQGRVFAPERLKIVTAKIAVHNKSIDKKLDSLRHEIDKIEPALAAVEGRAREAAVAWEPYRFVISRERIAGGLANLQFCEEALSQERPAKPAELAPRKPHNENGVEP